MEDYKSEVEVVWVESEPSSHNPRPNDASTNKEQQSGNPGSRLRQIEVSPLFPCSRHKILNFKIEYPPSKDFNKDLSWPRSVK